MYVSKDVLNRLKRINLKEFIINNYGVKGLIRASESTYNFVCPHPDHNDNRPSFSVWVKNEEWFWCCHACHCDKKNSISNGHKNYGTDIISFIRWMSDYKGSPKIYSFTEAAAMAAKYAGINITDSSKKIPREILIRTEVAKSLCLHLLELGEKSTPFKYLLDRGLDTKDIAEWGIGYNGARLMFPFFTKDRNVIGYSMRTLSPDKKVSKYINSPNDEYFNKSETFYGIHKINGNLDYLIVTEGQMDVIMAHKFDLENVVAVSGCAFKDTHAKIISEKFPNIRTIIFAFDSDDAGNKALEKANKIAAASGFSVNFVELPEGMDLCVYALKCKKNLKSNFFALVSPYFFKEFREEESVFRRMILNFHNRISNKVLNVSSCLNTPKDKQLFKSYLRTSFYMDTG